MKYKAAVKGQNMIIPFKYVKENKNMKLFVILGLHEKKSAQHFRHMCVCVLLQSPNILTQITLSY